MVMARMMGNGDGDDGDDDGDDYTLYPVHTLFIRHLYTL